MTPQGRATSITGRTRFDDRAVAPARPRAAWLAPVAIFVGSLACSNPRAALPADRGTGGAAGRAEGTGGAGGSSATSDGAVGDTLGTNGQGGSPMAAGTGGSASSPPTTDAAMMMTAAGTGGAPMQPATPRAAIEVLISTVGSELGAVHVSSIRGEIDCPSQCRAEVERGTSITLRATSDASSARFEGWAGDCSGSGECTLVLDSDRRVTAKFRSLVAWKQDIAQVTGLAVGGDAIYTAGYFKDTTLFAGMPRTSAGGFDIFFAKLNLAGELQWLKTYGGAEGDEGAGVAVAPGGDVVLMAKSWSGPLNLDGRTVGGTVNNVTFFAARYSAAGQIQRTFNQLGSTGLTFDGAGNLYLLSGNPNESFDVAKYGSNGAKLWQSEGAAAYMAQVVRTDAAGNVYVGGLFYGGVTIGGRKFNAVASERNVVVVKYDPAGKVLWANSLGSPGYMEVEDVVVDGRGDVYVSGLHASDFRAGSVVTPNSDGQNGFLARFAGGDGRLLWSHSLGAGTWNSFDGLAFDAQGNLLASSYTEQEVDFGGGLRQSGFALVRYEAATGAPLSIFDLRRSFNHIVPLSAGEFVFAGDGVARMLVP